MCSSDLNVIDECCNVGSERAVAVNVEKVTSDPQLEKGRDAIQRRSDWHHRKSSYNYKEHGFIPRAKSRRLRRILCNLRTIHGGE